MNPILSAVLLVAAVGAVGGVILAAASVLLRVPVDERVERVRRCLAGANCGACGYAGCDDYARAVVEEGVPVNRCTPGGVDCARAVGAVMGVEAEATVPKKAVVACAGTCDKTHKKFEYQGMKSCFALHSMYGGNGACPHGCLGCGDCAAACPFGAIAVGEDGVARVDRMLCVGCGVCVGVCPLRLISLVPEHKRKPVVLCRNAQKGVETRKACAAGCIGCMKCAKACPKQAITVENHLARIDQDKCVGCQLCVKECPVGAIAVPGSVQQGG